MLQRIPSVLLCSALVWVAHEPILAAAAAPETLVFERVTVVSMDPEDRRKVRKRRTVVIRNRRPRASRAKD